MRLAPRLAISVGVSHIPALFVQLLHSLGSIASLDKGIKSLVGNKPVKCVVNKCADDKPEEVVQLVEVDCAIGDLHRWIDGSDETRHCGRNTNSPL